MGFGLNVSRDLLWLLTNHHNAQIVKQRGIKKTFTRDPMNPKGIQTFRFSGNIQRKAISVEPHKHGRGVVLVYRKRYYQKKPVKSLARVTLIKNNRKTYMRIRRFCNKRFYRTDLKNLCIRRASAILRGQQERTGKRRAQRGKKPE